MNSGTGGNRSQAHLKLFMRETSGCDHMLHLSQNKNNSVFCSTLKITSKVWLFGYTERCLCNDTSCLLYR